jgi:MerR family mercuric resistance operon transcriptional regulator
MMLTVSSLAEQVGLRPHTLRYYERVGLLPAPARNAAGYRLYDEAVADRLRFIRGAQRFGLRLADIRELLQALDHGRCPCGHTEALLRERMAEIDAELGRLQALRAELDRMIKERPGAVAAAGQWWCEQEFTERGR